jgi:hypothetical protein
VLGTVFGAGQDGLFPQRGGFALLAQLLLNNVR